MTMTMIADVEVMTEMKTTGMTPMTMIVADAVTMTEMTMMMMKVIA